ncbi:MAG: enoyl-CoA hydratase-related protein [Actinomycetota bacterium]|nr:enoyl-CoA hydratase-related protein [Actinomycetota bacterium]
MSNPFEPHLLLERVGAIRVLTLNHPETLNSVDADLHRTLAQVWRHIAEDTDARAVVLTGAGRLFCAGGDLRLVQEMQGDVDRRSRLLIEARTIVEQMLNFPLPIVAAVNGAAVGLGASLAVLSDMVFIAENAYMADPHVAVGLTAGDGGPLAWPFMTSLLRAKEYLMTGDRIPAHQAVAIGIANRVVSDDDLLAEATAFAQRLAALPPQAVQSTRRALNLHLLSAAGGLLDFAFAEEFKSFDRPDHKAIVSAFLAKSTT